MKQKGVVRVQEKYIDRDTYSSATAIIYVPKNMY